jgi:hypothetical protein
MDQEVEAGQIRTTFQSLILLLMTIPGIDVLSARVILSEIGRDMSRFPTAGHLLSWAGLCPRNEESAGKRRSTRFAKRCPLAQDLAGPMCPGGRTQERQLLQCTIPPPSRAPRSQEGDLCSRTIYHMLKDGTQFQDLGTDHFDRRSKDVRAKRLVAQLANLGFDAKLTPLAQAA